MTTPRLREALYEYTLCISTRMDLPPSVAADLVSQQLQMIGSPKSNLREYWNEVVAASDECFAEMKAAKAQAKADLSNIIKPQAKP